MIGACSYFSRRSFALVCHAAFSFALLAYANNLEAETSASNPDAVSIEASDRLYSLSGSWRFFPGDRPEFADPDFDDGNWARVSGSSPWSRQGHDYDGIGWMRKELLLSPGVAERGLSVIFPFFYAAREVYFNGVYIGGQGEIGADGSLKRIDVRSDIVNVPAELIRSSGRNVLAIRVRSFYGLGGATAESFYISGAEHGRERYVQLRAFQAVLAALFLFVAITQIIIGLSTRPARYAFFFGLFALALASFQIGKHALIYWISDSFLLNRLVFNIGLNFLSPIMVYFFLRFFEERSRIAEALSLAAAGAFFGIFLLSWVWPVPLMSFYGNVVIQLNLLVNIITVAYCIFLAIRGALVSSPGAGLVLFGFGVFSVGVLNETLSYQTIINTPRMIDVFFLAFIAAVQAAVAVRIYRMHSSLEASEARYRALIESSTDAILTLDIHGIILDCNRATRDRLGYRMKNLAGRSFFELFYDSQVPGREHLSRALAREEYDRALHGGPSQVFRSVFRTQIGEPQEMELRFERIEGDHRQAPRISARLEAIVEDELSRLRHAESASYVIGNYVRQAELLSSKLVSGLWRSCGHDEVFSVKLCLREILVNAIEHGNLAISYDEKTAAQASGRYLELVQNRQRDPRFARRAVEVEYRLSARRAAYRITDQGDGFDHRRLMQKTIDEVNAENVLHGRGLLITMDQMDRIRYNDRGNSVLLIKHLHGVGGPAAAAAKETRNYVSG